MRVWIDYGEIVMGDVLLQNINHGLRNSRYCAALVSERYLEKPWTQLESSAALAVDMHGVRSMLLPIRHQMTGKALAERAPIWAGLIFSDSDRGAEVLAETILARITR